MPNGGEGLVVAGLRMLRNQWIGIVTVVLGLVVGFYVNDRAQSKDILTVTDKVQALEQIEKTHANKEEVGEKYRDLLRQLAEVRSSIDKLSERIDKVLLLEAEHAKSKGSGK